MTCIVGIVTKDGVTIGGDSAGIAGYELTIRKDSKVFIKDGFVFGFTSSFRMGQLLQYKFSTPLRDPKIDLDTYLRTEWIDALRKAFEAGGFTTKHDGQESGGSFLLGCEGRLFTVDDDFQVGESHDSYDAVGCGSPFAKGAMFGAGQELSAEAMAIRALECAEHHSAGVRRPFVVKHLMKK